MIGAWERKLFKVYCAALIVSLAALFYSSKPAPFRGPLPFRMAVHYYLSPSGPFSAVIVSLFAKTPDEGGITAISRSFCRSHLLLLLNGHHLPAQEVRKPLETVLRFTEGSHYRFVFRVPAGAIKAGDELLAVWREGPSETASRPASIAPAAASPIAALAQDAAVFSILGEGRKLARTAAAIISASPDSPLGYWYEGLAYEMLEDRAAALLSYRAAVARIDSSEGEIPAYLLLKRFGVLAAAGPVRGSDLPRNKERP